MKKFSLGFIFDQELRNVLLIHKNRPAWQAGKINGIGGKVEPGEDGLACIVRETEEECGIKTAPRKWHQVAMMKGPEWQIDVFYYIYDGPRDDAVTNEDQQIEWLPVRKLPSNVIFNLNWLIPLCIDTNRRGEIDAVTIIYNEKSLT